MKKKIVKILSHENERIMTNCCRLKPFSVAKINTRICLNSLFFFSFSSADDFVLFYASKSLVVLCHLTQPTQQFKWPLTWILSTLTILTAQSLPPLPWMLFLPPLPSPTSMLTRASTTCNSPTHPSPSLMFHVSTDRSRLSDKICFRRC